MINPNENNLTRDEPLPTPVQPGAEEIGPGGREQFRRATNKFSTAMSQTWDETKEKAGRARDRTEYFVRENPVPTILGALGLGIAIGLAIRFASTSERKSADGWTRPVASFRELSVDGRSASSSSPRLKKAIDEIGERTRILGHESVSTAIELSQPSARNGVNQFQCIGRWDHDIGRTGGN